MLSFFSPTVFVASDKQSSYHERSDSEDKDGRRLRDREVWTPIIDQLIAHAMREKVSLHVPGHHQGRTLFGPLAQWLGQATKWDVTELPGLDNLHHATGCIRASQARAAAHYGADHCFYSVNGATACVMAAIAASVQATGRNQVVILGPCHMSAWRGLVYADAGAVFVPSPWRQDIMTFGPPDPVQLANQLAQMRDVAAVFVTSPTYQGVVAPVAEIARVAHAYGVPLIVDEAHGAHLGLIDAFPRHSVEQGADIVIQSPHKTLPCLTQAAWVHVSGPLVEARLVEERLLFLETTSPSYLLLASLDGAQAWLHTEGAEAAQRTFECLQQYRSANAPIGVETDPMREWIPTGSANESQRLETMLQQRGIFVEFADATGVLAMFGFSQPAYEYGKFLRSWRRGVSSVHQRPQILRWSQNFISSREGRVLSSRQVKSRGTDVWPCLSVRQQGAFSRRRSRRIRRACPRCGRARRLARRSSTRLRRGCSLAGR